MSTRTEGRGSAAAEREHHRGNPWHQAARFIGLYLASGPALIAAWLIHLWIGGVHLHSGDWSLDQGGHALLWLIGTLFALLGTTGLISWLAWDFAEHRKTSLRASLAGSVALVGAFFCLNVAIGPNWRAAGCLTLASWAVATLWSIARLDVTRNDKTTDRPEDTFLEKVGLKGWKGMGKPVYDDKGERLATEVTFQHAPGDTVDQLQDAVPKFESVAGSPAGLSRATGVDGRADRSTLTVLHKDPLVEKVPLPEPSSPGGSIADGLMIGTYANGMKVMIYPGGPSPRLADGPASPSNLVIMGMTRTGKTVAENEMMTEMGTRRDVVILYLNKSKGMQDLRPVAPIVEVAVIESDDDASSSKYRDALTRIQAIMRYRQQQLGRFGISAWTSESCFADPPWRTDESGHRVRMEPMPFLYVHIGEADAIVSLTGDGERAKNIASKCLSLGVAIGPSLQRADHMSMPTGLRFNLGTALCFGCSDDESPRFTLSAPTIKAGAHPENWGQRKPGYFYVESPGVDEKLFPVAARTFSDSDKDTLSEKLLARNLEWTSRMARLDQGSVLATAYQDEDKKTHVWWTEMVAMTDGIRNSLLGRPATPSAEPVPDDPRPSRNSDEFADDTEEMERQEMERELRETTHVEGVELYPVDPQTGDRAKFEDATAPVQHAAPEDQLSWEDDKPGARDRAAAVEGAGRALLRLYERGDLKDPTDDRTVIVDMGMFLGEFPYRSRPFFVALIQDWLSGTEPVPYGLTFEAAPDLGADKARYRVSKVVPRP